LLAGSPTQGRSGDGEHRQVSISPELTAKIRAFIRERGIGDDDLLFEMPPFEVRRSTSTRPSPARNRIGG
jgi:hypothetical protein